MAIRQLIKRATGPIPVITVCAALLAVLCYLIFRSLSDDAPGQLQFWIWLIGGAGSAVLLFFLIANCYALYRQFARNELGSRLTVKMVGIFLLLMLIPFSLLYYFSIQFLSKGVDNWFDVRIEQSVQDAVFLGQASLESVLQEITTDVENYAKSLTEDMDAGRLSKIRRDLKIARELENYEELGVYTDTGMIIAFSIPDPIAIYPDPPRLEALNEFMQLPSGGIYTSLESIADDVQLFRVIAPIPTQNLSASNYVLQAVKLLPRRFATLANSVERASNQYDQMVFSRGPLRFTLILTLSLISLASLLFSILTAVYLSKRMVAPISNLASGTQKIAEGNYGTRLPVTSGDELGILTDSFNNMSSKIQDAQHVARSSQLETEQQKGYLEAVLINLSSGVFSFDDDKRLQICNSAAFDILGLPEDTVIGRTTSEITKQHEHLEKFMSAIEAGLGSGRAEWQDEVTILGTHGRQILIMRGTLLASEHNRADSQHNYVVVFDDVTNLIQAQRDAAWGEVARRLAHEIKNPLTPIQLSAERIRNKFSDQVDPDMRETLERSTRTIVQQVESMKEMVNAFSSYAQPVRATLLPLEVNHLIRDVVELHASSLSGIKVTLDLDDSLPQIKANATALRQVLNNLLINACHALEESAQPELMICTAIANQISGNYIDIVIADSGVGIPPDIRDSLFDPYVSSKAKGSGLGLAIVKRIVEEHSGSVWAGDSELGGTAMHVRLPINAMQTYRGNRGQNTLHSAQS